MSCRCHRKLISKFDTASGSNFHYVVSVVAVIFVMLLALLAAVSTFCALQTVVKLNDMTSIISNYYLLIHRSLDNDRLLKIKLYMYI